MESVVSSIEENSLSSPAPDRLHTRKCESFITQSMDA